MRIIKKSPIFKPFKRRSRYKVAHGGRGSGKSHEFAENVVLECLARPGLRVVCIREIQRSLRQSAKALIEKKIRALDVADKFRPLEREIHTPGGGVVIFEGMQAHTAESIKSLEGFDIAWVEESHTLCQKSLDLLLPTIRNPGSELWFSMNRRLKTDAVDKMFLSGPPPKGAIVVKALWSDNIHFPDVLNEERLTCLENNPDEYPHIWDGELVTASKNAYFAKQIQAMRAEDRLTKVPINPNMVVHLFADIGGTGSKSDNFVFWAAQFVGGAINVIDHYEVQGQDAAYHLEWLRTNKYVPGRSKIWLPHDGGTHDKVINVSYESVFKKADYDVAVIPNQGKGAAKLRIEAVRTKFPSVWMDAEKCEGGLLALSWYKEKVDEARDIGLGPEHNWSSHSCLPAGVKVTTARGLINIEDVTTDDMVVIGDVTARVTNSGYIKHSETMTIELTTGEVLECTPEHKIFTANGIFRADELIESESVSTEAAPLWDLRTLREIGIRKSVADGANPVAGGVSKISRIIRHPERVPVYDITVEHHQCYHANGVLVSNSDAFGLMAIVHDKHMVTMQRPNQRRRPQKIRRRV